MATTTSSMRVTAPARSFARPRDPLRRSVPRPRASASPASRLASRSIARRHRLVARSGSPFEVATPARTTTELDERDAFTRLMERAGVKHRVRLASGARGRGLCLAKLPTLAPLLVEDRLSRAVLEHPLLV